MNSTAVGRIDEQLEWKHQYVRYLRNYMLSGHEVDLNHLRNVTVKSEAIQLYDLIHLHEAMISRMNAHAEQDEAVQFVNRSHICLRQSMSILNFAEHRQAELSLLAYSGTESAGIQLSYAHEATWSGQAGHNNYERVLQQMDCAIVLFDEDGMLYFINVEMAKMLQVSRKELIGCTLSGLLRHPSISRDKRRMILKIYRETIIRRQRYNEYSDKQGRTYLVTFTYGEQMDGDYLFSIKDVSDYKRIEQTAVQNDKLAILGKIAASIAHEIRNPLTSIRGFIQLLRPHLIQLGKDEYARIILAEIDRANDIIFEFLNSSKPTAPFTSEISISTLIRDVVLLTESDAVMKGCQIIYDEKEMDHSLIVSIDSKQIKQVFLNMFRNAIDAIIEVLDKRQGCIHIWAERELKHVAVFIRDNGAGMDERTLERLFDPFFTTKDEGTGLGLSVSYRIVRNHGGTIEVKSKLEEWTEFVIRLPIRL